MPISSGRSSSNGRDAAAALPYCVPTIIGIALTWTSPALILAFFARKPARWVRALWAAALLAAAPNFFYYVNGYAQFGMRHALDFEPFLVALMMLGVRDRFPKWGYVLHCVLRARRAFGVAGSGTPSFECLS